MFVKIKLEPQSSKDLSPLKKISYFSIDDDATIINLKMKIEKYVDIPAERQEIRTLIKVFQNSWHVKEVCDVRGSAIMLYAYDDYYEHEEPQFICFLQVYTDELAAEQQELEQRSKLSKTYSEITTPTSSTSSVTLIASSDSGETDTDTSSSKSTASDLESDCSGNNSDLSCGKKRSKHEKIYPIKNKKLKVIPTSSKSQYSESLCQYLDEFPKCSKEINSTGDNMPDNKAQGPNECPSSKTITTEFNNELNENGNKHLANTCIQTTLTTQLAEQNTTKVQSNIVTTTNNKHKNKNIHPCYSINPEIRDYLAIICSSDANSISNVECEEMLVWFFDRFRACDSSKYLQFDTKTAISLFEGKIWIACMNMNTFEWVSANMRTYSLKPYKILSLKDSKHLCEVVVPVISNSKNVLDIFDLLEKQNNNITTLKWSLQSRQPLLAEDFNEKAISTFCTNELFNFFLDTESKKCLEKLNFKLKYCFWQIVFKFL